MKQRGTKAHPHANYLVVQTQIHQNLFLTFTDMSGLVRKRHPLGWLQHAHGR